uniref:ECF transporter S component n=1 Tax=Thermofilum pendens TaxID=2269 RepID=A0A7C3WJ74_THEPE
MKRTQKITLTGIMAALALGFSILRLEAPFPILPYLKFDAAEIPVTIAFYLCGLKYGVTAEIIHYLGLVARGSNPVNAAMKLLAVLAMLVGLAAPFKSMLLRVLSAVALRAATMTVMNYLYLFVFFPHFLSFALKYVGSVEALFAYTAIFNALHTALSVGLAWATYRAVTRRLGSELSLV